MSIVKQEWAICHWQDKETAIYVPICQPINEKIIDAYGRYVYNPSYSSPTPRRPYKTDTADGVTYVMYDDDAAGAVPVIRITEEEEAEE